MGDAIGEYEAALRIEPNVVEAETGLGNTLRQVPGREAKALQHLQTAVRIAPSFAPAHYNLGVCAGGHSSPRTGSSAGVWGGDPAGADTPEVRVNLGCALLMQPGRASEAIAQFEQALRLDPRSAEAENDLALELGRDPERLAEAAAHFEKALESIPTFTDGAPTASGPVRSQWNAWWGRSA